MSKKPNLNLDEEIALRISEGIDYLDQVNAIYNFAFFGLGSFIGTGDPEWDHRLAATVNVANLLGHYYEEDQETISKATEKIVKNLLPRLLCVALVSAIETCLEDIVELKLRSKTHSADDNEINKKASGLMKGGPAQYLPQISDLFHIDLFKDKSWNYFNELVATRNIIVHKGLPVADKGYVKNAGPFKRASLGKSVDVDNIYLVRRYSVMKNCLFQLLPHFEPKSKKL